MSNWTRQHFETVASTVHQNVYSVEERERVCRAFDEQFQRANERYSSEMFMDACMDGR